MTTAVVTKTPRRKQQKVAAQKRFRITAKGKAVMANANDKRRYGLSPGERAVIETAQGNVCAICGRPPKSRRLHVDHHHACSKVDLRGSVRGLLCMPCNMGFYQQSPMLMRKAADYFERHLLECPKLIGVA